MPGIISESFPNAIKLPEKVTPPMIVAIPIAIIETRLEVVKANNSAEATRRLDAPPKPFNKATNSGIDVIFILIAAIAPTAPPPIRPIKIN